MHSKRKIPDSWRTGWKAKACTSFVLYLKIFKNHLYYLRHVRVLSIKPCLHTQLPEHNKSYRKVSRGWGHLITWNGPMMGHLNSFSASGGGNFPNIFQKFKCPGGLPGGDVEASIWLVHYAASKSTLITDSSAPVMHRDPSDLGLLILIRNAHGPDDELIGEPRVGREGR